jgi:branched-chain amino acid transport system substrate-binding protein
MPRGAGGLVAAVVAVTVALSGCTPGPMPTPTPTLPTPSGDGVLRIGTIFSSTGPDAATAGGQTAAVNAAQRELDAAGGVLGSPVEVLNRDGGAAGDGLAEAAFAELVAAGVDAVIGPSSSELAAVLAPLAAAARVPLISASAVGDRPGDSAAWYLRTVTPWHAQGVALAGMLGDVSAVAVLRSDDATGAAIAAGLADGLAAGEGAVTVDAVADTDGAAAAREALAADPGAVVIATNGPGDQTVAAIAALAAGGYAPDRIWVLGGAVADYSTRIPDGALAGAHAIRTGIPSDPAFTTRVLQEDPGAPSLAYSAEAYDAAVLAALAATLAGDDGGASIAAELRAVAAGGIPCHSFGECVDVLRTQTDIAYEGASGPLQLGEDGDRVAGLYAVYEYDAAGALTATGNAAG